MKNLQLHVCENCNKTFDTDLVEEKAEVVYVMDEYSDDIPYTIYKYLCPHCGSWTE